jgi:DnaJ-class molecular chaperone
MSARSPFEILGVAETATDEEIKAAYRNLVKRWHPDLNPGDRHAEEVFKAIAEAYERIRSPEGRAAWTRPRGTGWERGASGRPDADTAPPRPNPYDAAFDAFHGEEVEIRSGTRATLDLTLEEAVFGARRPVRLSHGTIEVDVPEGVEDGEEIVLRGAVPSPVRGRPASDLRVSVRVRPDPVWKREGLDLLRGFEVDPAVAVVGGERRVSLLDGRTVWVKVPPGTQPGTWVRLAGLGVRRGTRRGDVRLEMRIRIPTFPAGEARRLWEELERLGRER